MRLTSRLLKLEGRVNLVDFLKLNENEQAKIYKGCINKPKLDDLEQVTKALIEKYQEKKVTLNYYECDTCGGFHLTKSGKRRRRLIKHMILKTLAGGKI